MIIIIWIQQRLKERTRIMKKRNICIGILGVVTAGAVALAGCKGQGTAVQGQTAVVAGGASSDASKTISVEASESIALTPDMAEIGIGVSNQAETIEEVTEQNTKAVDAIVEKFKSLGYEESSISTSDVGLHPQYDYSGSEQKLIGYNMNTTIYVSDVPADKVSEALNGALESGANTINSIRYFASSYDEGYAEALGEALKSAEEKASSIASKAGLELSGIVSITEHTPNDYARYSNTNGYMDYGMARNEASVAKSAAFDMAVLPGTVDAAASVTVVYGIK